MFTVEFESNNQEQPGFDDRILGIENPAACASIAPTADSHSAYAPSSIRSSSPYHGALK